MLQNFLTSKLLENLAFLPTPGQEKLITDLAAFLADDDPGEIMLVKGYAGTGKTTLLNSLVKTLANSGQKYQLLAPTGRAAKVLSAYTGRSAWTVHKKIYRQKSGRDGLGEFVLDRNLHTNTLFIVDEASMIGDRSPESLFGTGDLLRDMLDYVEAGTRCRLLLAGDTAQLPPVGLDVSPALNRERLEAFGYRVREIELTDVVRQSTQSGILVNATSIRSLITAQKAAYPDLRFHSFEDIDAITGEEVLEQISRSYEQYGLAETMVITRSNKRANRFNAAIRNQILWREDQLCAGDLLMVVKNNYFWKDDDHRIDFIANGDTVKVERVRRTEEIHGHRFANLTISLPDYHLTELEVKVLLDVIDLEGPSMTHEQQRNLYTSVEEDYPGVTGRREKAGKIAQDPYYNALQVKFAYAVTCHKAQGGQWKSVFLDQGYFTDEMLTIDYLRWLYTAFTRATDRLWMVNPARQFIPR